MGRAREWAIVGGGLLGCTLALRLRQAGHEVTLYEAAPELGGLASAWSIGDIVWDRHYHVTLASDRHTRAVLREVGLESEMEWVVTKTGFYADGRLSSLSNAVEYLRLPALGLVDKARLAATILAGSRIRNWQRLEQVPVTDWLARWSGRRVLERLWIPLLRAKLGESYRETSAAFLWATIQRLYAARRSGMKRELFGYVPGGYARILARLGDLLVERGVEVALATPVAAVERADGGLVVHSARGRRAFDQVVVTSNPPQALRLCGLLDAGERARLEAIRYQGVLCASLLLDHALADYYLTYITEPDVPFTAVVEMSAFVDRKELGGHHLVYLPKYLAPEDPLFDASDEEIRERFLPYLERMYPHFRRAGILAFRISRVRHVFPVPSLGYSRRVPPLRTGVPGLSLVSSAHIVNGTLNVNETVELAERAARELLATPRAGDCG
jgi:protoporphyrinogen oxidase